MPAPERIPAGRVTAPAAGPAAPGPAGDGRDGPGPSDRELIAHGELTVRGRIREASNAVLYCSVSYRGRTAHCVYKPVAGERPLWDFPDGTLAQREVAAYEVSEATGWGLVPPTVLREGPYGEGMCQLWIEVEDQPEGEPGTDAAVGATAGGHAEGATADGHADDGTTDGVGPVAPLLALVEDDEPGEGWKAVGSAEVGEGRTALLVHADDPRLRRLAVLDAVINNGDRKGGHLLPAPGGRLYAIDHGVTFNVDDKLRTLLWGWAGEPLTGEALEVLARLADALADGGPLATRLAELITPAETDAVRARIRELRHTGRHPEPSGQWPAIPWPPV
ncbi:SCO1664 family protein [Streptomyces sp. NPDC059142]|uniref:SCO1664 family protein n=1 Tax=Streptomyces sp. NPDC059142 TaxID=3346739 RepID=UPI0036AC9D47